MYILMSFPCLYTSCRQSENDIEMLNYRMGENMTVDDDIPHTSVPVMSLLPDTESVSPYKSSVDCVMSYLTLFTEMKTLGYYTVSFIL